MFALNMALRVKIFEVSVGHPLAILNESDARAMGILPHDRVKITHGKSDTTAFVNVSETMVQPGEIGLFEDVSKEIGVKDGDEVTVSILKPPRSIEAIHKKIKGETLSKDEIYAIIEDVVKHRLSDVEMAGFLLAEEFHGMTMEEIEYLTRAMAETGVMIDFDRPVYDKHSIGGVPGNKVTLLIVPIVAAAGLLIPKTSSRAITSPSGTADTMSVLAPVTFTAEELKELVEKVGGAIVWGGGTNIAPADDDLIKIEYALKIDPRSQMLASIMAKKLAVGADCLVIDIPIGPEAKVEDMAEGRKLANQFVELGERLGMRVQCGLTYGGQPVGHAVGPALEAKEALEALQGKGPSSLVEKSTALAGILLEMAGLAPIGGGKDLAKSILERGKALEKMREIIEAQGGDPNVKPEDIPLGEYRITIKAQCDGYVTGVSNMAVNAIARAAGAPVEKGAGVIVYWKRGAKVKKGDPLLEIFAERESKLSEAYSVATRLRPITIEGMLLQRVPSFP